ncbi:helix-turn-helix domain-containing protein [Poritiphilus flavus]|uniref:Helix-turn-helix domain-containing protein n=1 Tax=Poritiphilus flavus TaxID=2697053 RepID=A0A6L9EBZ0_9FLAO|nr:helix-turn-helix transcriptional regulator [Poritiphilus flavus]NAS12240.1 helix-turn-helix domain-containing protein [Poritiphilus flavus]
MQCEVLYVVMDNEKELKQLGEKFAKARESLGLSQTEFANSIGKDQPSINRLEKGKINPSYIYLLEVCKGLKMKLSELLESF